MILWQIVLWVCDFREYVKEQKEHSLYLYAVEGYVQVGDIWRVLVVLEVGKKGQTKKENLAKKSPQRWLSGPRASR